jgi:hypothetical protein
VPEYEVLGPEGLGDWEDLEDLEDLEPEPDQKVCHHHHCHLHRHQVLDSVLEHLSRKAF